MTAPSPSKLDAARAAPDRAARTRHMADIMAERAAANGACEFQHLRAAGFTEAEIWAYADDARALLSGRKVQADSIISARRFGKNLVAQAKKIRQRIHAAQEVQR